MFNAAFSIVNFASIFKTTNKKITHPTFWTGCFFKSSGILGFSDWSVELSYSDEILYMTDHLVRFQYFMD